MMNILGMQQVSFDFDASKQSTRTQSATLKAPSGTDGTVVWLQSFDLGYSDDHQYGFGRFSIELSALSNQSAQCRVTVRDDTTDEREWDGNVTAMAVFYQGSMQE